jgi:hypothetical protein
LTFSEHSYGFRPGRSAYQAMEQAQADVAEGYRLSEGTRTTALEWHPIRYRNVIAVLKNPFYAGAYVYFNCRFIRPDYRLPLWGLVWANTARCQAAKSSPRSYSAARAEECGSSEVNFSRWADMHDEGFMHSN